MLCLWLCYLNMVVPCFCHEPSSKPLEISHFPWRCDVSMMIGVEPETGCGEHSSPMDTDLSLDLKVLELGLWMQEEQIRLLILPDVCNSSIAFSPCSVLAESTPRVHGEMVFCLASLPKLCVPGSEGETLPSLHFQPALLIPPQTQRQHVLLPSP